MNKQKGTRRAVTVDTPVKPPLAMDITNAIFSYYEVSKSAHPYHAYASEII